MSGFVYPSKSVYNILPSEETVTQKPPRYMSKFRPAVLHEHKSSKDTKKTMGPVEVEPPAPEKFLKKHSKEVKSPEKTQALKEACSHSARKPPVPARTDQPLMGLQTKRDFVKTVTAAPMKPQPACVDSSKGHKQPLQNSGLIPQYVKKKDYGEVPEYLLQRNEEERMALEKFKNSVREQREQRAMKKLSEEERRNILEGLRKKRDLLQQEFNTLSFVADTMTKRAHRISVEDKLTQLEKDIALIERFKTIYVPKEQDVR